MALIALGITGSVGAYKSVEVARGLQKRGHDVVVIMTSAAQQFIGPLTLGAITHRNVITDQFASGLNSSVEHVSLASTIDALVVAPATANVIGKFANGIADDFLSSLQLVTRAPIVMAPAMNSNMWTHEAVARNLATLRERGVHLVDPETGELACGWVGPGRLAEPERIVSAVEDVLRPVGSLLGRSVLVTAGPTYEDLDPVRYLGNRSTGRMGLALAAEAARRGGKVVVVLGPTSLVPAAGLESVRVRSAAEMYEAVMTRRESTDLMILAAAVADYTPEEGARPQKIPKGDGPLTLTLARSRDILADLGGWRGSRRTPVLVGFAAETHEVVERARAKLLGKGVDLIVANNVSRADAGFEVDANAVTLVTADTETAVPLRAKAEVARVVVDHVESLLASAAPVATEDR